MLGNSPRNQQIPLNVLAKKLPEIQDLPFSHRLSILGPGCLLGDDDILSKTSTDYSCTCKCYSTKGVLFEVAREDFLKYISLEPSLRAVREVVSHKNKHKLGHDLQDYVRETGEDDRKPYEISVKDISVLKPAEFY